MGVNNRWLSHDVETAVWKMLNGSIVKTTITGGIYKEGFRPTNSKKEDISIAVLSMTQDNPQLAVVNVNVFVPDTEQKINNVLEKIPNTARLAELAEKIKSAIDTALVAPQFLGIAFKVNYQRVFANQDNESKEHFNNLRIEFIIPN